MRVTYDRSANAAYIYLVPTVDEGQITKTYACDPIEIVGQINLDFDASGQLLGIEVLDADRLLSEELLKEAEIID